MVRRTKWTRRNEGMAGIEEQTANAMNLSRLDRFAQSHRRNDRRDPFREHRFAAPGRAEHQHILVELTNSFRKPPPLLTKARAQQSIPRRQQSFTCLPTPEGFIRWGTNFFVSVYELWSGVPGRLTMGKHQTSSFRGVYWSKQKKCWVYRCRREGLQILCETELEAAMLYNAVARKIWPGCKMNPTPIASRNSEWIVGGNLGMGFWLAPDRYAVVDQVKTPNTPVTYYELRGIEWFYRDGFAIAAEYVPAEKRFNEYPMHYVVFGGPAKHRSGETLDNRRVNLIGLHEPDGEPEPPLFGINKAAGSAGPLR